jgi:hypothetical protein
MESFIAAVTAFASMLDENLVIDYSTGLNSKSLV